MTKPCSSANTPPDDAPQDYVKKLAGKIHDYFTQPAEPAFPPELTARFPGFATLVQDLRDGNYPVKAAALQMICTELDSDPEPSKLQQSIAYLVNYVPSRWLLALPPSLSPPSPTGIYLASVFLSAWCLSGVRAHLHLVLRLPRCILIRLRYISSVSAGLFHSWFAAG